MIAEAVDTVITLGWAFLVWIVLLAATATLALWAVVVTVAWVCRATWRGVAVAVAAVQPFWAPVSPQPACAASQPPQRPSWARTVKDAA